MAEDALDNLDGHLLKNGKKLCVAFFQNMKDRQEEQRQAFYNTCIDRNLFVSNLDETINDRKLKQAFAKYGTIRSVKIMVKGGRSKGYGFVCFSTADEATAAIADMNGKELDSKPIYVTLRKDQTKRSQSTNYRYPQTNSGTQKFHPIFRPKNVLNYFETPMSNVPSSSNGWTPFISRFSNRLPRTQPQLNSRENSSPYNRYSPLHSAGLQFKQPIHPNENTASNDEDEED